MDRRFFMLQIILLNNNMKFLYAVLALVIVGSATATTVYSIDYQIPTWTKNTALYWGQGDIDDGEYINFLQYLVEKEIIVVPSDNSAVISQLDNQVASLEAEISSLKGSITSDLQSAYEDGYNDGNQVSNIVDETPIVQDVSEFTNTISQLENQITSLENQIGSLNLEVAEVNSQIASRDSQISILNSEITSLENSLSELLDYDAGVSSNPATQVDIITVDESGFSQACVDDGCYVPSNLTANVGDTIVMTNTDPTGVHTYTSGTVNGFTPSPDGTFDSGVLMSGDAFEWTPTQTGEYPYYCMLHTWMVGTITVN